MRPCDANFRRFSKPPPTRMTLMDWFSVRLALICVKLLGQCSNTAG